VYYRIRPEAVDRFRAIAGEFAPALGMPPARGLPVVQGIAAAATR
jgi:hypothetical protein